MGIAMFSRVMSNCRSGKTRALIAIFCAALLSLPVVAYAGEIEPRVGTTQRYPFSMAVTTDRGRSDQTRTIPKYSSFSYHNKTDLGGRTLYVQLYTTSGAAYTYQKAFTGSNEQQQLTATSNGVLSITPHLWLSSGSLYLQGEWVIITQHI